MGYVYSAPPLYSMPACSVGRRYRHDARRREADEMPIIQIDGLPYVAPDWLQRRIAHDETMAERWRQQAEPLRNCTDPEGQAMRPSYLRNALQASYRANRWRQALAVTLAAMRAHS